MEKLLRAFWGSLFALASSACSTVVNAPIAFLPNGTDIVAATETAKGLFFTANETLHVWKDGVTSVLFPLKIVDDGSEGQRIFFDARGDHVAVQSPDTELVVYSVPAGSTVLRVPKVRDLRAVAFDGSSARALTYAGESQSEVLSAFVTEYDLSTSKQRGRIELDVVMRLDRPGFFSFGLGGGWTLYRSYVLGPRGLFAGKLEESTFEMNRMPWAN